MEKQLIELGFWGGGLGQYKFDGKFVGRYRRRAYYEDGYIDIVDMVYDREGDGGFDHITRQQVNSIEDVKKVLKDYNVI